MGYSQYPDALDSYTYRTDLIDDVNAQDVNELQDAIAAIEATLGTNPEGTLTDLKTRLAVSIDDSGNITTSSTTASIFTIGLNNSSTTPYLKFGTTYDKRLTWDNDNTRFDLNSNLRVQGAITFSGNLSQSGSGTISTGTGDISLNGDVTIATGKSLTVGSTITSSGSIYPATDNTYDLGSSVYEWRNAHIDGYLYVDRISLDVSIQGTNQHPVFYVRNTGDATFHVMPLTGTTQTANIFEVNDQDWTDFFSIGNTGNCYIKGDVTIGGAISSIAGHILPSTDNTYDLGSSTYEWRNIHIDGIAYLDDIYTTSIRAISSAHFYIYTKDATHSVIIAGYSGQSTDIFSVQNSSWTHLFDVDQSGNVEVAGTLEIGGNYTLPSSDGSDGQVLKTDGAGTVTWEDIGTYYCNYYTTTFTMTAGGGDTTKTIPFDWTNGYLKVYRSDETDEWVEPDIDQYETSYDALTNAGYNDEQIYVHCEGASLDDAHVGYPKTQNETGIPKSATTTSVTFDDDGNDTRYLKIFVWA